MRYTNRHFTYLLTYLRPAVDIAGDAVGGAYSYSTAVDSVWLEDSSNVSQHLWYTSLLTATLLRSTPSKTFQLSCCSDINSIKFTKRTLRINYFSRDTQNVYAAAGSTVVVL